MLETLKKLLPSHVEEQEDSKVSTKLLEHIRALGNLIDARVKTTEEREALFRAWVTYFATLREGGDTKVIKKRNSYEAQTGNYEKAIKFWKKVKKSGGIPILPTDRSFICRIN